MFSTVRGTFDAVMVVVKVESAQSRSMHATCRVS